MTHVLILRVPAPTADEISDRIWQEEGVLGIQEGPSSTSSMFPVSEDFQILEFGSEAAKRCAVWLEKESFRQGAELYLHVYLDPPEQFMPEAFVESVRGGRVADLISFTALESTDYLENYRKSVQGASFGEGLWIGPPWAKPLEGERAFFVEPGLAFGTGGHPTTQLCFERLVALAKANDANAPKSFLDLGTGSGILGVAVRRFFPAASLEVSDLDPLCRDEVAKTFALNGMENSIPEGFFGPQGSAASLLAAGKRYECVVSNIYAEILAQIAPEVAQLLPVGGRWIVSGILRGPAEDQLLQVIKGLFRESWKESRTQDTSQLDSQGGLKAIQETWAAYEFVRLG